MRFVSCVFLFAIVLAGCESKPQATVAEKKKPSDEAVPVTVATVQVRSVPRVVSGVGELRGWEEVTLGAKRGGRVVKVYHEMGDRVRPGEPLIELDPVDADLAIAQAEQSLAAQLAQVGLSELPPPGGFDELKVASVVQAAATREKANQNLTRERNLRSKSMNAQTDYQNAELDARVADASFESARQTARATLAQARVNKAALDVARQQRADLTIRAPIPSKTYGSASQDFTYAVSTRKVSEGQTLKEGDAVVSLVVDNPLKLWINIQEAYVSEVKVGQEAHIQVSSHQGQIFKGSVARINPMVDSAHRTFQVEVIVPNEDRKFHPGTFASAQIVIKQNDRAVTVPLHAIVKPEKVGLKKVFLVSEKNTAKEVIVNTTDQYGADWEEVEGQIPPGAKVIITGQTRLHDGKPVIIKDAAPPPAAPTKATPSAEAAKASPAAG